MSTHGKRAVLLFVLLPALAALAAEKPLPILLVQGMTWNLDKPDNIWGYPADAEDGATEWTGMIGYLQSEGCPFGGVIRPSDGRIKLPKCIDTEGVDVNPRKAAVFELRFSTSADTDGLAYKAVELAEAVKQLCRYTRSPKVRLVTHSAGGLVARVYLQSALPGIEYRGDVDRLITISTPHLGSALASHWGDFLGTRATSLKPEAAIIRELNDKFDLPGDVTFASIVVRGIGADAKGKGKELDELVDKEYLERLPVGYRLGGDQVVHVRSQNLRLARCTARYEELSGRPVHYSVAGVPDPSPKDRWPTEARVHGVSPADPTVQKYVQMYLQGDHLWSKMSPRQWIAWTTQQTRTHVEGAIAAGALDRHPMSEAREVELQEINITKRDENSVQLTFIGDAYSINKLIRLRKRWTRVQGTLELEFDDFARVVNCTVDVEKAKDM